MTTFVLGVLSSIFATLILYFLRFNLGFIINLIFYKIYPSVSGEYNYYQYRTSAVPRDGESLHQEQGKKISNQKLLEWLRNKSKDKTHFILKLKQFANRINGEVYSIKGTDIEHVEKITGRITPSRILVLNSETIDEKHHNFGTYLLNLTNDLNIIKGTASGLCINCGDATSEYVLLEKK